MAQGGAQINSNGISLDSAGPAGLPLAPSAGNLTVTGSATSWVNTGSLEVGVLAATPAQVSKVTVTAGAALSSGADVVGVNAGSNGAISVTAGLTSLGTTVGGTLTDTGLTIGQSGTGALTVSGVGSKVTTTGVSVIGSNAGGKGTATVSGGGAWTTTEALTIGDTGSGTLTVGTGSSVSAGSVTVGNSGTITLAGGTLSLSSPLPSLLRVHATMSGFGTVNGSITDNGTISASGGVLTLSGPVGGIGQLNIDVGATLDVNTTGANDTISFQDSTGTLVAQQVGTVGAIISGFVGYNRPECIEVRTGRHGNDRRGRADGDERCSQGDAVAYRLRQWQFLQRDRGFQRHRDICWCSDCHGGRTDRRHRQQ